MDIVHFLSNIFLFETCSSQELRLIEASTSLKNLTKGDLLFSDGQKASAFFIIVSGSIKIYKLSAEGNEHIIHVQKPGDLVAEAAIFDKETYPAFGEALESTALIRISKENFITLLCRNPEMTMKILAAYSRRLRFLVERLEELSLHDIKSRVATYLLKNSQLKAERHIYQLNFSKKDFAALLGTIPETLSRTLGLFKKQKILIEKGDKIIIQDIDKLKSFV
ncbi:Crp/Fnr family transcriptional regulator [candidate division KSB1 bacterium]|nr:Crp/Fnr family transcriptional regulator [candidate division KSB1 bacterium]